MSCLTTGSAKSSLDLVLRRLEQLDEEAKEVTAKLDTAWADYYGNPDNQQLQQTVDDLEKAQDVLDRRREVLEAKLAGATLGCLLVSAQQVP